jgi:hypothetical protein
MDSIIKILIISFLLVFFSCNKKEKEINKIVIYYTLPNIHSTVPFTVVFFNELKPERIITNKDSIDIIFKKLNTLSKCKNKFTNPDVFFRADFVSENGKLISQLTSCGSVFYFNNKRYYLDKEIFKLLYLEKDYSEIDNYYDDEMLDFLKEQY